MSYLPFVHQEPWRIKWKVMEMKNLHHFGVLVTDSLLGTSLLFFTSGR